jgi:arginine deiminase
LGANIIGRLSDTVSGTLEGGDFFPVSENLAMLGVGLRTNQEAADYLLDNDLFGTSNVALVHDREDCDQERMHLDTYFNILSDKDVLLLDFDTVEKSRTRDIRRTVDIYTKGVNGRYTRTK